jgi:hypothetical protein
MPARPSGYAMSVSYVVRKNCSPNCITRFPQCPIPRCFLSNISFSMEGLPQPPVLQFSILKDSHTIATIAMTKKWLMTFIILTDRYHKYKIQRRCPSIPKSQWPLPPRLQTNFQKTNFLTMLRLPSEHYQLVKDYITFALQEQQLCRNWSFSFGASMHFIWTDG